jgi:O-antigen/teichoic acid export membrane protein
MTDRRPLLRYQIGYIFRNAPVLALGTVLSNILALLVLVAFNELGDPKSYGVYNFITSILAFAAITTFTGMQPATMVAAAQNKPHILRRACRLRIRFGALLGCPVLLILALVMIYRGQEHLQAGYAFLILLPFFPALFAFTGVHSYLNGLRQFTLVALFQIINSFLNLLSVTLALWFWPGWMILPPIAMLASRACFEGFIYYYLIRRDKIPLRDADREIISYGMKLSLTGVSGTVETYIDRIVIGVIYGFTDLGLFSGGRAIAQALKQVPHLYYQLYAPKLVKKSPAEALRLTDRVVVYGVIAAIPLFAVIYWALPWVYTEFLGKFKDSILYARLFLIMVVVGLPWYFYFPFFHSQRRARSEIIVRYTRAVIILFGLLVLIYFYGIVGAIYAEILATALLSVHSWYEAHKPQRQQLVGS